MSNKMRTIVVTTKEISKDPAEFDALRTFAMKDGTVSQMLNNLLQEAISLINSQDEHSSDEMELGDFWAEMTGIYTDSLVQLLNECGKFYFLKNQMPLIYFVDEKTDKVDEIMVEDMLSRRAKI